MKLCLNYTIAYGYVGKNDLLVSRMIKYGSHISWASHEMEINDKVKSWPVKSISITDISLSLNDAHMRRTGFTVLYITDAS